ncbi:MAG: hypothetical protein ING44_05715 [Telmatospirillum sp.]|nr:hypothetical protein [Telmatospirillum sp.]
MANPLRRFLRVLALVGFALAAAACQHYAAIGPGTYDVHGKMAVQLDSQWNRQVAGPRAPWAEIWTRHGPFLDALVIAAGVAAGKPLVDARSTTAEQMPKFSPGMAPGDLVTLVQGTLGFAEKASDFETLRVETARIDGHEAVRFEFTFGTGAQRGFETDRKALGVAVEVEGQLYLVLFHAVDTHYFDALRPTVEAVIASIRFPAKRA